MQKQVITVSNVRFAKDVIGSIKFVAGKKGTVKCVPKVKGHTLNTIRVGLYNDTAMFEAGVYDGKGIVTFLTAKTPEKAFRRAVRAYWGA